MRIAQVITGLGTGGAERQVADLSRALVERGHAVRIVSLTGEDQRLPVDPRIEVDMLGLARGRLASLPRCLQRLRRALADFAPDVVHSHMFHANVLTRLVRPTAAVPRLLSTSHSTYEGGRLRALALRCTDHWSDRTACVSDAVARSLVARRACPAAKIEIVHNGIDTTEFAHLPARRAASRAALEVGDAAPLLLAVGRLVEAKDYPNLLAAFARVLQRQPRALLAIAGAGDGHAALVAQAAASGLTDRVRWLGLRTDIAELMNAADLFVLSSAWEGFGLVVAEAMACERLVVATDCGGVREVLGPCGWLVPPRDPQALADACSAALALPAPQRRVLGQAARTRVLQHFSLDAAVERWLRLYRRPDASHAD